MGRRCIQFSGGVLQPRLALRVSVCDGHRHIDARRVRRCNRVTPDQGGHMHGLGELARLGVTESCLPPVTHAARRAFSPMGRRYIQFSDGSFQSRLTLRVSVCDGHRRMDARRVRRCNRVTPDQVTMRGQAHWVQQAEAALHPGYLLSPRVETSQKYVGQIPARGMGRTRSRPAWPRPAPRI